MGCKFFGQFFFLLFDGLNKSKGILSFIHFWMGGPFLHGNGGQFLVKKCFSYFLMIQTNLKEFLSFNHTVVK